MPRYLVERYWPGATEEQFMDAARRSEQAAADLVNEGVDIRFVRSTYMREEETIFDVFDAATAAEAALVSARAALRYDRIVEALEAHPAT